MNEYQIIINVVHGGFVTNTLSVDAEYYDAVLEVINSVTKDFLANKIAGYDLREEIYKRLHDEVGQGFSDITDDTVVVDLDCIRRGIANENIRGEGDEA